MNIFKQFCQFTTVKETLTVRYVLKFVEQQTKRTNVTLPLTRQVPQWYIRSRAKLCTNLLKTPNHIAGLTVFDPKTLKITIYLDNYVNLDTMWGKGILIHELVHSFQVIDNRYNEDTVILEAEAIALQKLFIEKHGLRVADSMFCS